MHSLPPTPRVIGPLPWQARFRPRYFSPQASGLNPTTPVFSAVAGVRKRGDLRDAAELQSMPHAMWSTIIQSNRVERVRKEK